MCRVVEFDWTLPLKVKSAEHRQHKQPSSKARHQNHMQGEFEAQALANIVCVFSGTLRQQLNVVQLQG